MEDWIHTRLPLYDDRYIFDVWDGEHKREVRRVGNESLSTTPGTLIYTDCSHPLQNMICREADIVAWRINRPFQESQYSVRLRQTLNDMSRSQLAALQATHRAQHMRLSLLGLGAGTQSYQSALFHPCGDDDLCAHNVWS